MSNGQEIRKYKRTWKQYMARLKIRSDEAQEMESYDWDSVILRNLSAGGTYFFHKKDLGIGTLVDLKIEVPKAIFIINCVGEIVRSDKPHSTSMFCFAIKFTEIGEQEKEAINEALAEQAEEDAFNNLSMKYSPRFGEIAIDKGFATEKQINEALAEQAEDDFSNKPHRFVGSILFEHGLITKKQIDIILYELYKFFEEEELIMWTCHSP